MINGLEIIEKWNFFRAVISIPLAIILFSFLWFLGNSFAKKFLNDKETVLKTGVGFCLVLILICLVFFILSALGLLSKIFLVGILFILLPIGIYSIFKNFKNLTNLYRNIKIYNTNFSVTLIVFMLLLSLSVAILPTTKMDEISYHMLFPLRVINDGIILPYPIPWEASILPQMVYQLFFTPFFYIGFPEVGNVFSLLVFIYSGFLMQRLCESTFNISIPIIFMALFFFSGLFLVVDIITISSSALAVLASVLSFGTLINVASKRDSLNRYSSFSLGIGLLALGFSKVTTLPIIFLSWTIYCFWILKNSVYINKLSNIFLSGILPLIIYIKVLLITYYIYGSPFGSMFGEFFKSNFVNYDPFAQSAGAVLNINEIAFLSVTKFNPLVWIFTFVLSIFLINSNYRFLIIIFFSQFFIILFFLPDKPRHFQGIQLVLASFVMGIVLSKLPRNFNFFKFSANFVTLVYTGLIFYYTAPLIYNGYFNSKNSFFIKYIPYYKNFSDLNRLLPVKAKISFNGSPRINLYHSPRPLVNPRKENEECIFYFVVGKGEIREDHEIFYSDQSAVQYTFRTPNKAPILNMLKVYYLKNNCKKGLNKK